MALTEQQLDELHKTKEVRIETLENGKATRTIIWVVVAEGDVYVRSVQGDDGNWYQRALAEPAVAVVVGEDRMAFQAVHADDEATIDLVSKALEAKYAPGGSLDRMTRDEVLDNTLRLDPAG